jgi:4-amino-4-deoxy-L-arabinose transferase-like glycosyltransferase
MNNFLNKTLHTPMWLFFLLFVVLIVRIPTLFEPYSYGDEMIYLALGEGVRQGVPLYSGLHDNKPPLLYLTAALAGNLFWFRAILALWSLFTIFLFYKLADSMYPSEGKKAKNKLFTPISTLIFSVLTTLPFWEGNIANAENFMIGFTVLAFYIVWKGSATPSKIFLAGLLLSVASLFKIPAAFELPALVFLWLATLKNFSRESLGGVIKKTCYLLLGFIAPIVISFVYYYLAGAFKEYLIAAYLQNVGYLSSFRPGDVQKPFLEKNAPLLIRGLIVAAGLIILFIKRRVLSKQFIFTTAWLLLTLFAITLSERPYPHYLLQAAPAVAILFGIFFTVRNMEQILVIIPLTLFFFVPRYFHFWGYPTLSYYSRFIDYASGQMSKDEYIRSFGSNVTRAYKVSEFLVSSTNRSDRVLVWGDASIVYAISRRLPPIKYLVGYHINDFSSTEIVVTKLIQNPPPFIVLLPDEKVPGVLDNFIKKDYALTETIDGAQIWKLLNPKIRSLLDQAEY